MGRYEIRLGSTISFDAEKERDLINIVEALTKKHKLGTFLSHLLRIYNEQADSLQDRSKTRDMIIELEKYGLSSQRREFFNSVSKDIDDMKNKVDEIYDMCNKMYVLAEMGKRIGLEQKTENMMMVEFMLENQLNELSHKLGVDNVRHMFNRDSLVEPKNRAHATMEYMLNSYDNIINQLERNVVASTANTVAIGRTDETKPIAKTIAKVEVDPFEMRFEPLTAEPTKPVNKVEVDPFSMSFEPLSVEPEVIKPAEPVKIDEPIKSAEPIKANNAKVENEDEEIDFGNADFGALASFLGMKN